MKAAAAHASTRNWRPPLSTAVCVGALLWFAFARWPYAVANVGHVLVVRGSGDLAMTVEHPLYGLQSDALPGSIAPATRDLAMPLNGSQLQDARQLLEVAAERTQNVPEYLWLARSALLAGQPAVAENHAQQAVARSTAAPAYRELAYAQFAQAEYVAAAASFAQAHSSVGRDYWLAAILQQFVACAGDGCRTEQLERANALQQHHPLELWAAAGAIRPTAESLLLEARWDFSERTLQGMAATVLAQAEAEGVLPSAAVANVLALWVDQQADHAITTYLDAADGMANRDRLQWQARSLAARGDFPAAYALLASLIADPCDAPCREAVAYAQRVAADARTDADTRSQLQSVVADGLTLYSQAEPDDLLALRDRDSVRYRAVTADSLAALTRAACGPNPGASPDSRNLLPPTDAQGTWLDAGNRPPHFGASAMGIERASLLSATGTDAVRLYGLAPDPIGEPFWVGFTTLLPIRLTPESVYALRFVYRTGPADDQIDAHVELTTGVLYPLPATAGVWRSFAVIVPASAVENRVRPAFRLYRASGSLFLDELGLVQITGVTARDCRLTGSLDAGE